MNQRASHHSNFDRKLVLAFIGVISVLAVAATVLNAPLIHAQSNSSSIRSLPAFHNVSITWSGDSPGDPMMFDTCVDVHYTGVTLAEVISRVYQVPANQVAGSNKSSRDILAKRYDIKATADRCAPLAQVRQMTKALLNDRFKLVVRNEARAQKVYIIGLGKNGPKLQNARLGSPKVIEENDDVIVFHNHSIAMACEFLRGIMSHPVLDETGLTGSYDFSLKVHYHGVEGLSGPGPYFGDLSFESIRKSAEGLGLQFKVGKSRAPNILVVKAETPEQH